MGTGTLSERIRIARSKIEERFDSFEKTLLDEISSHNMFVGSLNQESEEAKESKNTGESPVKTVLPPIGTGARPPESEKEILQLKKALQDDQAKTKTLEEAIERLRESLQVMGQERNEFSNQVHAFEEKIKGLQESILKRDSENALLKKRAETSGPRRLQSARFWRRFAKHYRSQKNLARTEAQKSRELTEQAVRLTSELDAALELIAELRDELHGVGYYQPPQHPKNKSS